MLELGAGMLPWKPGKCLSPLSLWLQFPLDHSSVRPLHFSPCNNRNVLAPQRHLYFPPLGLMTNAVQHRCPAGREQYWPLAKTSDCKIWFVLFTHSNPHLPPNSWGVNILINADKILHCSQTRSVCRAPHHFLTCVALPPCGLYGKLQCSKAKCLQLHHHLDAQVAYSRVGSFTQRTMERFSTCFSSNTEQVLVFERFYVKIGDKWRGKQHTLLPQWSLA